MIRNRPSLRSEVVGGAREIDRVPVDDGGDDQIEAGGAERLAVERAVADLAALVEKHRAFQLVRGFAFVQSALAAPT